MSDYDNENDSDPGIGLSINTGDGDNDYESEDEAAIRARAAMNSPKGKMNMSFAGTNEDIEEEDGNLSLPGIANGDEQDMDVTPNTKKRDHLNLNSPRAGAHQSGFNNGGGGAASLMTQVDRPDPNSGGGGAESLVTQVPREEDKTQEELNNLTQQPSGGICACFSCLFTCCSSPPAAEIEMDKTNSSGSSNKYQKTADTSTTNLDKSKAKQNGNSNGGGNNGQSAQAGTSNNQTNSGNGGYNETANVPLVGSANSNNNTSTASDDSHTDTEYDPVPLLPPLKAEHKGKKCLVLDLDETLVHSSFKPIPDPHFIIPVEIDRVVHHVYVLKRPFVDEFMLRASKDYEIVIFTASLSKYADPLLDKLDIHNVISHRLFRESCVIHGTAYVKDMTKIGRRLRDSIIVDNSPPSYLFQPTNAIPIASWFDDTKDTQLLDLLPVLETTLKNVRDVRCVLDANEKSYRWLCQQAHKPLSSFTVRN